MAQSTKKEVARVDADLEELAVLAGETAQIEKDTRESSGRQYNYLKLLGNTAQDPITKKGKPEYIEGAADGVWVIPNKKLCLGEEVSVTVLGMFKVYEDSISGEQDVKSKQEPMRQIVGYWLPEDAEQIPVVGMFDRPYMDNSGEEHILRPCHWVFVHLHDHPEVEDAVISFRGKANKVYKDLQKLIAANATTTTELRFTLSHQEMTAANWQKSYLYAMFEIEGNNYKIEDGKITLTRGGLRGDELAHVIKTSHKMNKEYQENVIVSKKTNIKALVGGTGATKQIGLDEDDGTEGSPARF